MVTYSILECTGVDCRQEDECINGQCPGFCRISLLTFKIFEHNLSVPSLVIAYL